MQADMLAQTRQQILNPAHRGLVTLRDHWWHLPVVIYPWWNNTLGLFAEFGYEFELTHTFDTVVLVRVDRLFVNVSGDYVIALFYQEGEVVRAGLVQP